MRKKEKIVVCYLLGNLCPLVQLPRNFLENTLETLRSLSNNDDDTLPVRLIATHTKKGACNMCDTLSSPSRFCGLSNDSVEQCDILSSSTSFSNSFQVPNHTEFDCPLTIISCSYEKIGCETKVST